MTLTPPGHEARRGRDLKTQAQLERDIAETLADQQLRSHDEKNRTRRRDARDTDDGVQRRRRVGQGWSLAARGAAAATGTGMMRQLGCLSNNRGDWLVDFQLAPNPVGMPEDWIEQAATICQNTEMRFNLLRPQNMYT
jgi:hypothetical protein